MDITRLRKNISFLSSPALHFTGINQEKTSWTVLKKMENQKAFYIPIRHKAEHDTGGDKTGFLT